MELAIEELAERAGVPVRTIRYYISEGIIPGAEARGKGAAYSEEHLLRLLLVRRLTEQRVLLADIQKKLAGLNLEQVRALLQEEEERAEEMERAEQQSPRRYLSVLLNQAREARGARPRKDAMVPSARTLTSSQEEGTIEAGESWKRLELAPGLELHIRADTETRYASLLQRILRLARRQSSQDEN